MFLKLKILVAPLDWGLGHATRCLPLIDYLVAKGHEVILAGAGPSATVLREHFPQLTCLPLPGYEISYSKNKSVFALKMAAQLPKIMHVIRRENVWLKHQHRQRQFDLIISDNRYGLHLPHVPSVIMTHQLAIQSGFGKSVNTLLRKWHYRLLQQFSECWIVDDPEEGGMSGALAHPEIIPPQSKYIGLLSQFGLHTSDVETNDAAVPEHILVLLSGPEPGRGDLERLLLSQIKELEAAYHFTVVAGNPLGSRPLDLPAHVDYHLYATASTLYRLMKDAGLVICRSGYSSIMDLVYMNKNAVLIPTPGQTEQEYLASYLSGKKMFRTQAQKRFQLSKVIREAFPFGGHRNARMDPHARMKTTVDGMINKVVSFVDGVSSATGATTSFS